MMLPLFTCACLVIEEYYTKYRFWVVFREGVATEYDVYAFGTIVGNVSICVCDIGATDLLHLTY